MIGAIILWPILKKIKLERYVDRRSSVQIANGCLDFMICGAVASIQLDIVADNLVAITVLCAVLTLFVTVYCLVVIRKTCREDWFEKAAILFGQNTGSTASGLTLLKMVDPEMESTALEDFGIFQSTLGPVTAILMAVFPAVIVSSGNITVPMIGGIIVFVPAMIVLVCSIIKKA